MTRKGHRVAATQAALGKRKRTRRVLRPPGSSAEPLGQPHTLGAEAALVPQAMPQVGSPSLKAPLPPKGPLLEQYRYVIGEMKRIGVLAAGIFVILVILGFILR